jgi:hypothetical protein
MTPCCLHAWLHSSTIAGGCEIYIALKPGLNPSKPIERQDRSRNRNFNRQNRAAQGDSYRMSFAPRFFVQSLEHFASSVVILKCRDKNNNLFRKELNYL